MRQACLLLLALVGCRSDAPVSPAPGLPPEEPAGNVRLERRNLVGHRFEHEQLYRIQLTGSDISGASFTMSFLGSGDLSGVRAVDTRFLQADLSRCNLSSAKLLGADLRRANLFETELHDTDLRGASLAGASVKRTRFARAHLRGTVLEPLLGWTPEAFADAACWDEKTIWPAGFTPDEPVRGCHLHR